MFGKDGKLGADIHFAFLFLVIGNEKAATTTLMDIGAIEQQKLDHARVFVDDCQVQSCLALTTQTTIPSLLRDALQFMESGWTKLTPVVLAKANVVDHVGKVVEQSFGDFVVHFAVVHQAQVQKSFADPATLGNVKANELLCLY